jgi:hypothetical protein
LLLEIPRSSFVNEPSLTDAPTTIDINSNRCLPLYNGIVSTNNICETIAPASPTVTDQWNATVEKFTTLAAHENAQRHRQLLVTVAAYER